MAARTFRRQLSERQRRPCAGRAGPSRRSMLLWSTGPMACASRSLALSPTASSPCGAGRVKFVPAPTLGSAQHCTPRELPSANGLLIQQAASNKRQPSTCNRQPFVVASFISLLLCGDVSLRSCDFVANSAHQPSRVRFAKSHRPKDMSAPPRDWQCQPSWWRPCVGRSVHQVCRSSYVAGSLVSAHRRGTDGVLRSRRPGDKS